MKILVPVHPRSFIIATPPDEVQLQLPGFHPKP